MKLFLRLSFLIVVALIATGCRRGRAPGPFPARDAGPPIGSPDARSDPDAGPLPGFDAGPLPGFDAGPPPRMDAGPLPPMCPPVTEPLPAGRACSSTTYSCAMMAASGAEIQTCLDADVNAAACNACVNAQIISCATTTGGCDGEWGNFVCCFDENCSGLTGAALETCLDTMCSSQSMAFSTCIGTSGCGITTHCFAI
jgi:hypothetical protein